MRQLTNRGFEVGLHGLYHDGKYFDSRKIFNERTAVGRVRVLARQATSRLSDILDGAPPGF